MSRGVPSIVYTVTPRPTGLNGTGYPVSDVDFQGLLASESHYRLPNGAWSGGGPFYVHKESVKNLGERKALFRGNGYGGIFTIVNVGGAGVVSASPSSLPSAILAMEEAQAYGLRGFNRTKPGKPLVDLFVGVKELYSDGLPSLPFRKAIFGKKNRWGLPTFLPFKALPGAIKNVIKDYRSLGSEYLNVVFGWKPFVKDLRDLYEAMMTWERALNKLKAQNGHSIRRRATLKDDVSTSQTEEFHPFAYWNVNGSPPNWFGSTGGSLCTVTTTTSTKIWYSAGYRYWIPDLTSWQWDAKAKLALFGLLPTPGRLWEAMPWSWLADWFTDIGEIAEAVSPTAVDNLVQLYGYTMYHDVVNVEAAVYTYHGGADTEMYIPWIDQTLGFRFDASEHKYSTVHRTERKIRAGGFNPFGPNVTLDSLSAGQNGILAALGISKLPRI